MLSGGENHNVDELKAQIRTLKDELADLKTTKKMETREIEHLVKLKEKKLDIEYKEKELELQCQYKTEEMKMQREYHGKLVANIDVARTEMKEVYTGIMERLPNVNLEITKKK